MKNSLALEKWIIKTIYSETGLHLYSYVHDNPAYPYMQISSIAIEPWLVWPVSEKIIMVLNICSRQTSNEEILRLTENVKKTLNAFRPDFAVKSEIEEVECFHDLNYWQANIGIAYYLIGGGVK